MNEKHLAQLEAHLEQITEGIFARFFGKRIQVHDVALQLLRALENSLQPPQDGDSRPLAPDLFTIHVSAEALKQISTYYPGLEQALSNQIVEIANTAAYRLKNTPQVRFVAAPGYGQAQISVSASYMKPQHGTTAAMKPIKLANAHPNPAGAQLVITGERAIALTQPILHLGRDPSNDIVIADLKVSRSHAQIRLRFGHYMIFDTDSAGGTFVNNVQIQEHRLQPGDVISIGQTTLVYMEAEDQESEPPTQSINPVP